MNRKGFTLVELLAVIVILAVIVGISLVTIIPAINNSKLRSFRVTLDTTERWVTQQFEMMSFHSSYTETEVSNDFINVCGIDGSKCYYEKGNSSKQGVILNTMEDTGDITKEMARKFISAAGLKPENYTSFLVAISKTNARVCIKATMSTNGEFFYASAVSSNENYYQSTSCGIDSFEGLPTITNSIQYVK